MDEFAQTEGLPLILPGVAGTVFTVTASTCTGEVPQLLFAVTVTFPLKELAVEVMLAEVDVPVHPLGRVHVYELAFATGPTE